MTDSRGLFGKFIVRRIDGTDAPGEKHDGCNYFVLDMNHDPHAIPALRAYAKSCAIERPALSLDLTSIADGNKMMVERPSIDLLRAAPASATPEPPAKVKQAVFLYLNTLTITSDNIGDIRRSLFMPYDCRWNGWVRDMTAELENQSSAPAPLPAPTAEPCSWECLSCGATGIAALLPYSCGECGKAMTERVGAALPERVSEGKECANGHVWSHQFGDDWTPEVGTPCDCRLKQWGRPAVEPREEPRHE